MVVVAVGGDGDDDCNSMADCTCRVIIRLPCCSRSCCCSEYISSSDRIDKGNNVSSSSSRMRLRSLFVVRLLVVVVVVAVAAVEVEVLVLVGESKLVRIKSRTNVATG